MSTRAAPTGKERKNAYWWITPRRRGLGWPPAGCESVEGVSAVIVIGVDAQNLLPDEKKIRADARWSKGWGWRQGWTER